MDEASVHPDRALCRKGHLMHLEPMPEGGFVVDALDLGPLLGIDPSRVPELMRDGRITNRFEHGEGEDEGRFRVTFLYEGVTVRLIVTADGTVVERSRILRPPSATRR